MDTSRIGTLVARSGHLACLPRLSQAARYGALAAAVALPLAAAAPAAAEAARVPSAQRYVLPFDVLQGKPDLSAGEGRGYWLWEDDGGLHMRTTTRGQVHVFRGVIRTAAGNSFSGVTTIRLEDGEINNDVVAQPDDDTIRFWFHIWDGVDGVDFQLQGSGFCVELLDAGEAVNATHLGAGQVKPGALPVCFRR
jgi:hypothetical protein